MFKRIWCSLMLFCAITCALIVTAPQSSLAQAAGQTLATPGATASATAGQTITLDEIHMVNDLEGWAVKRTDLFFNTILHTQDGGKTWSNVTPPGPFSDHACDRAVTLFLDNLHAIVIYGPDIWHTADAGKTWVIAVYPRENGFPSGNFFSFVDVDHGWLMTTDCCAAGNEPAWLYQTTDGGSTFVLVADTEFGHIQNLSTAYHTGLAFATQQEGWMTLSSIAGYGALTYTADGGRNWRGIDLPIPKGEKTLDGCDMSDPAAFLPKTLLFVATCYLGDYEKKEAAFLYRTNDDGKTWTINRITVPGAVNPLILGGPHIIFISPNVIWLWTGRDPGTVKLFQSDDGGATWQRLTQFDDVTVAQIVTENLLWAFSKSGELLHTNDAGRTWTTIYPQADFTRMPEYPDCRQG